MAVGDASNKQLVNARHVSVHPVSRINNPFVMDAEDRQTDRVRSVLFNDVWMAGERNVSWKCWWNVNDKEKSKYSERKLSQCHFVHQIPHAD